MSRVAMAYPAGYQTDTNRLQERARTELTVAKKENKDKDKDYEEIDSDGDGSYHSDGDDLAEYWDPYRKQRRDCLLNRPA